MYVTSEFYKKYSKSSCFKLTWLLEVFKLEILSAEPQNTHLNSRVMNKANEENTHSKETADNFFLWRRKKGDFWTLWCQGNLPYFYDSFVYNSFLLPLTVVILTWGLGSPKFNRFSSSIELGKPGKPLIRIIHSYLVGKDSGKRIFLPLILITTTTTREGLWINDH